MTDVERDMWIMPRLLSASVRHDPYPFYARLGRAGLQRCALTGVWVAAGYDEVAQLLKDDDLASPVRREVLGQLTDEGLPEGSVLWGVAEMLFLVEGDQHRHARSDFLEVFRGSVAALRPDLPALVGEEIDRGCVVGRLDAATVARRISERIVCRLGGFAPGAAALLWEAAATFQPLLGFRLNRREMDAMSALAARLDAELVGGEQVLDGGLVAGWFERQERAPAVGLVASLVSGLLNPLSCGLHTVMGLVMTSAETREMLDDGAVGAEAVFTEAMRLEVPLQWVGRHARRRGEIGGDIVDEGAPVLLLVGAANRDERRFPDGAALRPDRRASVPALTFGYGAHHCVGSQLSRAAGVATIDELVMRSDRFAPSVEPIAMSWRSTRTGFRSPVDGVFDLCVA